MLQRDYSEKLIMPSEIKGKYNAPTSKNLTQRAIIAASLAKGISNISNANIAEDVMCFIEIFEKLNVKFQITGNNIYVDSRNLHFSGNDFNCGESAFCVRTMSAILSLFPDKKNITGIGTLLNRNFQDILQLNKFDINVHLIDLKLPITLDNILKSGNIEIDGSYSSQLISGLLFAIPILTNKSILKVKNPVSKPYIDMTLDIMRKFGVFIDMKKYKNSIIFHIRGNQSYKPTNITLENDWSNTAILLVIAAIAGEIEINNINANSLQGDKAINEILKSANAKININEDSISIKKSKLRAFTFNAENNPDLVPALMILALKCDGLSIIEGISRLKNKESDRANILARQLNEFGADIKIESDKILINKSQISGGRANSASDHRIAMALTAAGLISKNGIKIRNANSVNKSFPEFYEIINKLCI